MRLRPRALAALRSKPPRQLKKVRSDDKAFQAALMDKQLNGECVSISPGTQVEGSIEPADNSILRVNEKIEPPGYEAPLEDFQTKATDEKHEKKHKD